MATVQYDTDTTQKNLLILADDLTGALDTGVQFAKKGIESRVYPFFPSAQEPSTQNISVQVINTNSRHASPEEARKTIMAAVSAFKSYSFFYKKTDSCLRGNIGAELESLIHATGSRQLPFIPAYPALNRITREGCQYLDGKPIHKSDMANDPLNPITESFIPAIIEKQSAIPVRLIPVNGEIPASQNTPEIIIFDAERPEHLQTIANELCKKDMLTVSAGCAGFAEALMGVLTLERKSTALKIDEHEINKTNESFRNTTKKLPVLIITGSLHPVSVIQVKDALAKNIPGYSIAGEIIADSCWDESAEAESLAASCVKALMEKRICIFGTEAAFGTGAAFRIANADKVDVTRKAKANNGGADVAIVSDCIANALGGTALKIIQKAGPLHLVVFGGDSLLGIIKSLNYSSLIPIKEILPGTVISRPVAETGSGLLVTKAGAFGEKDLIQKIAEIINTRRLD
jgi:uncharacterized protein YgbK (DUF1537 family)